MASPLKKYAFINAKLRARLSKLLTDEFLEQLIHAQSLDESVKFFQNTNFSFIDTIYSKTGDLKSVELELYNREIGLYLELEKYARHEVLRFVKALTNLFEIENLKNTLRLWFDRVVRKRDISVPYLYLYRNKIHFNLKIDSIIGADSIEEIASLLIGTPYSSIIRKASSWITERNSIFLAEILLDKHFYRTISKEFKNLKGRDVAIAKRIIGIEIDLQNIDWLIRFKTMYNLPIEEALLYTVPHGSALSREKVAAVYQAQNPQELLAGYLSRSYPGLEPLLATKAHDSASRFAVIERILDHIMMFEITRSITGYPFTIGIILAYFIRKRYEIRKIVTILNAKYYDLPEERIKGKL
jgi:V/A-type H+-transporting ATPase subunit C